MADKIHEQFNNTALLMVGTKSELGYCTYHNYCGEHYVVPIVV